MQPVAAPAICSKGCIAPCIEFGAISPKAKVPTITGDGSRFTRSFLLPAGNMASSSPDKLPRGERIKAELREFAILATYLFVCFSALAGFKAAILSA
jgi:hypothetical protein